jgi:hypothetical protein
MKFSGSKLNRVLHVLLYALFESCVEFSLLEILLNRTATAIEMMYKLTKKHSESSKLRFELLRMLIRSQDLENAFAFVDSSIIFNTFQCQVGSDFRIPVITYASMFTHCH